MTATISPINPLSSLDHAAIGLLRRGEAARYEFEGPHKRVAVCDLIVVNERDSADHLAPFLGSVVLLSERADNPGTSITNYFAQLATQVRKTFLSHVDPDKIRWIEHYPKRVSANGVTIGGETFDRVAMSWNPDHSCYTNISWSRLSLRGVVIP